MIRPFDRPSHPVSQRNNSQDKLSGNLVEAHDWMGPDTLADSRTAPIPAELMNTPEQQS